MFAETGQNVSHDLMDVNTKICNILINNKMRRDFIIVIAGIL